ncbi:hypothetical protein A3F02_00215 [Candidatus Curtissbacteria bacterium RIFCSPHIGHO2_12_FULL_38_9b]|uniref:DUF4870 domain-containing protein n=1 Tax=Candidatus Curtissbacteria bacterium RIFCSPHIGHO2_12_FULL_38_9b TaxID=1797720 RepID=A0A1F5GYE5_9BACT|nr:MAG: hypothetical protein A3F02_00215 [Candidatus Curtissbacteria bacterium RIFCSPHIGHO2_12_FULL_38_9b]
MANNDSNRNLVAALSYLLGFVTGIVIFLVEKDDKFIRFHALQSTIVTAGLLVINIAVGVILRPIGLLDAIAGFFNILIWLVIVLIIFVSFIRAYQGQMFKWPVAGKFAEKQVR